MHFQTFVYKTSNAYKTNDDRHTIICAGGPNVKIGLMIQTGTHDLSRNPLRRNLANVLPSLKQTFNLLHAEIFVKILVTGPPPFNLAQENILGRSNDKIAIYDSLLMKIAQERNLPYFSMFEVIYLRYRHCVDHSSHYVICKLPSHIYVTRRIYMWGQFRNVGFSRSSQNLNKSIFLNKTKINKFNQLWFITRAYVTVFWLTSILLVSCIIHW